MYNNLNEFPLILGCLWVGFVLGIGYDLLRLFRIRRGAIATAVCDLAFAALFFGLTGSALLMLDSGRLRAYSIPVVLLGFLVWQYAPGRLIRVELSSLVSRLRARRAKRRAEM